MSFGRKSAALDGSTLTPLISTAPVKINWKPVKGSVQADPALTPSEQNVAGISLVITIRVSPTEIVEPLVALGRLHPLDVELPPRPFYALRHKERYRSRAADALLDIIAAG